MLTPMVPNSARHRARLALGLVAIASLIAGAPGPAAAHEADGTQRVGRGAPTAGLTAMSSGRCAGAFRIDQTGYCTHGPDSRSELRLARSVTARLAGPTGAAAASVTCDGDGISGQRVQAIYAHGPSTASRYATLLPDLRSYAGDIQNVFLVSADETGGIRRPRWVTDAQCRLSVIEVGLSNSAQSNFNTTINELQALGYNRSDRKYLVWFDANVYCGIGTWWGDDSVGAGNLSNTTSGYSRADTPCWDWAESHELMHNLGGVQNSAPHSSSLQGGFAHCSDEYDLMCYPDAAGVEMDFVCIVSHDPLFDCGHDDYYDTNPGASSYLGTHWNPTNNAWLAHTKVDLLAPRIRLTADALVEPSGVMTTVTFAGSAPVAGLETIALSRRQDAAAWQSVGGVGATATQTTTRLPGAHVHRFRVRATGDDSLPAAWSSGEVRRLRVRQEGASMLHFTGGWKLASDATALGGASRWSGKAGAAVTFSTSAADVALVASRGPNRGIAEVFVDGTKVATIDLYATSLQPRRTVYVRHFATTGAHTVRVRVTGTHAASSTGNRVDLDAMALLIPAS